MAQTFEKQSIGLEAAQKAAAVAVGEAAKLGLCVTVAVCDESGILKAMCRMDGAALITVQSAQDKAYTAAGFGLATIKWYPRIKDEPAVLNGLVPSIDRMIIYGGGVPIKVDNVVVGAVGVGGGSHKQDDEIATKAVEAISA
jgi:uncharacterized protein GlcG (DUF336 family)